MFCAVHLAHLLLLTDDDMRAGHIHLALLHVLRALEPVQQVRPDRAVEVQSQAGDDGREDRRCARGRFRQVLHVCRELLEQLLDGGLPREGDELRGRCEVSIKSMQWELGDADLPVLRDGFPVVHQLDLERFRNDELHLWLSSAIVLNIIIRWR